MRLSDDFMQELKSKIDITDIISRYVSLTKKGRNMVGLCPFHGEKTPSFNVYPENGSFYCFGCGIGGDVITFLRQIDNLDYMEAVRFLADLAGIKLQEEEDYQDKANKKNIIYSINKEAARYYNSILFSSKGDCALSYLTNRGLNVNTIKHFGLGYSESSRFSLVNHLQSKGYKKDDMVLANLAYHNKNGYVIDRFSDRVMFPIISTSGNIIAFGGRLLNDGKPKYLNTSDTLVFKKSNNLFALNFAKNSKEKKLILCEGYMDVISLHQAGFKNAVATLGTALTPDQARLISRYAEEVVISYDSDEAGQKATDRAISLFKETGIITRVLCIPNGKDPDEFIKKFGKDGAVRFKKILDESQNSTEYKLQKARLGKNLETSDGKIAYLTEASCILASLNSKIEQQVYAGRLSNELNIDKTSILIQVDKIAAKKKKSDRAKSFREIREKTMPLKDNVNPEKTKNLRAAMAEEALISYIIHNPDKTEKILNRLPPADFCTSFNRRVYEMITGRILNGKSVDITDLSAEFSLEEMSRISKIVCYYVPGSATDEALNEYINSILEEGEKIKFNSMDNNNLNDIENYLKKLRELKTGRKKND